MSKRALVSIAIASLAIASGVVVAACLDTTPFIVPAPDSAVEPPPPVDAGPDAPDVDQRPPCQQCIEAPTSDGGCADLLGVCLADPKCNGTYQCMLLHQCLTKADQRKIILCGLPCAAEAGIMSQFEQSANEIYDVATCAEMNCAGPCGIEAGTD
jgi:hypothetical protein